MMIENSTPENEIPFGSFGTFDGFDVTADWTDEDWAIHNEAADEFFAARYEAEADFYDYEPSPYDGTYSEM